MLTYTEARLALDAAEAAHNALVREKCAAAGVAYLSAAADKALANDVEIAKSYLARCKAEHACAVAAGDDDDAHACGIYVDDARREVARLLTISAAAGMRDHGTCVLGAGVALDVTVKKSPRSKKTTVERRILVRAPFQGNTASRAACEPALAFLRDEGLAVYWYDGAID